MVFDGRTYEALRQWLITGIVVTIPLIVTLAVVLFVLSFLLDLLSPIVDAITYLWPGQPPAPLVQAITAATLLGTIIGVGFAADRTDTDRITDAIDRVMESIPGVSSVYASFRRVSDVLLSDDTESFQDVKLVEFPHQDAFVLAFVTAETSAVIRESTGHKEMRTLSVPLGPNPTTNAFVVHLPADRVYDVDLSVEEAIRTTATLGVAMNRDEIEDD